MLTFIALAAIATSKVMTVVLGACDLALVIATAMHPPAERHLVARVRGVHLAAGMRPQHLANPGRL